MDDTFTDAFDSLWEALPSGQAKVRVGTEVVERVLASGIERTNDQDDLSTFVVVSCSLRLKAVDEKPKAPLARGQVVEVQFIGHGSEVWYKLRIDGRKESAGILTLTMNDEFE